MRRLLILLCLLWPATVTAQVAPAVVTTLRTTDTSTTSIKVGCTSGGSCTGGITGGPIDVSSVTSGGFIGIANNVPGATTMRLYNDAGTLKWNGTTLATGGSISGTTGKLAKFTAPDAVGNSICSESGTTITCVNTISATTLTGTLSTATQNSVTTMTALATVGTIGTGVWQGTKVGLAYGGTNADLSGTGGTSQFLRQNTLGGAVTVVRPAVADLSDGSNVALLNAADAFTDATDSTNSTTGAIKTAGGLGVAKAANIGTTLGVAGATIALKTTAPSIAANYAALSLNGAGQIMSGAAANESLFLLDNGYYDGAWKYRTTAAASYLGISSGAFNWYTASSGTAGNAITWLTQMSLSNAGLLTVSGSVTAGTSAGAFGNGYKWGINAAGDWTFGSSSHIADSSGTPTCGDANCSSITAGGTDYAFQANGAVGATTSMTITFGHTFANAPICVASGPAGGGPTSVILATATTTGLTLTYGSWAGAILHVLCRGY